MALHLGAGKSTNYASMGEDRKDNSYRSSDVVQRLLSKAASLKATRSNTED
jgi:hypothetical protein